MPERAAADAERGGQGGAAAGAGAGCQGRCAPPAAAGAAAEAPGSSHQLQKVQGDVRHAAFCLLQIWYPSGECSTLSSPEGVHQGALPDKAVVPSLQAQLGQRPAAGMCPELGLLCMRSVDMPN